MENRPDLRSMSSAELCDFVTALGWPPFRGRQLFRQIQKKSARDFAAMSDLPLNLRTQLASRAFLCAPQVVAESLSRQRDTAKLLLEFADGERVEMALMLYAREQSRDRATCCVSSQSGCAMGCRFCATGLFDRFRNMTAGEIVSQVQLADALAQRLGFPGVTNVVYMGMGEPLMNMENVRRSIELLNNEQGLNIGARRITVSTCGLVPQIYQMAAWGIQINLAVSLHSADQKKRRELMPVASRYSLPELKAACLEYQRITGRRVTFEYALIKGVNDSPADARLLGEFLTECHILVNIISANALSERGIGTPDNAGCAEFCRTVASFGVETALRESRGRDIEAACGQLRKRAETL